MCQTVSVAQPPPHRGRADSVRPHKLRETHQSRTVGLVLQQEADRGHLAVRGRPHQCAVAHLVRLVHVLHCRCQSREEVTRRARSGSYSYLVLHRGTLSIRENATEGTRVAEGFLAAKLTANVFQLVNFFVIKSATHLNMVYDKGFMNKWTLHTPLLSTLNHHHQFPG